MWSKLSKTSLSVVRELSLCTIRRRWEMIFKKKCTINWKSYIRSVLVYGLINVFRSPDQSVLNWWLRPASRVLNQTSTRLKLTSSHSTSSCWKSVRSGKFHLCVSSTWSLHFIKSHPSQPSLTNWNIFGLMNNSKHRSGYRWAQSQKVSVTSSCSAARAAPAGSAS